MNSRVNACSVCACGARYFVRFKGSELFFELSVCTFIVFLCFCARTRQSKFVVLMNCFLHVCSCVCALFPSDMTRDISPVF